MPYHRTRSERKAKWSANQASIPGRKAVTLAHVAVTVGNAATVRFSASGSAPSAPNTFASGGAAMMPMNDGNEQPVQGAAHQKRK